LWRYGDVGFEAFLTAGTVLQSAVTSGREKAAKGSTRAKIS
jgi:hypothetical protein